MSQDSMHLALFNDIDPAADAIERLRELGIPDEKMTVISGVPYSDKMFGRPLPHTRVPLLAGVGFLVGFVISLALNWGTPFLYPIRVGGMPYQPIPTTAVLTFEISMLGLLVFAFLGVIWESKFPVLGEHIYDPEISNGKIAVAFDCPPEIHTQAHTELEKLGAEWVQRTEAKKL